MSNSSVTSRIDPQFKPSAKPEEDFNFYFQLVAPLVPKLHDEAEQELAAEWLEKLVEDKRNPKLRIEYLLLLLFAMQRRQLGGPFLSCPNEDEPLPPFEDNLDMFQMMTKMLKQRYKPADIQPYYSELSGDFKEYVVTQEIPDFGVHCYYATSHEPIHAWKNAHLAQLPRETTAEAYQIGSRTCFEFQRRPSQFPPPTAAAPFEEIVIPGVEAQRSEFPVNLGMIPVEQFISKESMPPGPPTMPNSVVERVPSRRSRGNVVPNVQEVPMEALNRPQVDYNEQFIRRLQLEDSLTEEEMACLMAEFEVKLGPEMSDESNIPAVTQKQELPSKIPRPTPSKVTARTKSNQTPASRPIHNRNRNIPIRKV